MDWLNWFAIILPIITAIGSIALVIVTYLYLRETRRMRDISAQALTIDSSPMVFIDAIETHLLLDEPKKGLQIQARIVLKNTGKTEARTIMLKYKIILGERIQVPWKLQETPYIFPTQEITFNTDHVFIDLNDKEIQNAIEQVQSGKSILFPSETKPKLKIEIEVNYRGFGDEPQRIPYLCEYLWDLGKWDLLVLPKKEEASHERQ